MSGKLRVAVFSILARESHAHMHARRLRMSLGPNYRARHQKWARSVTINPAGQLK